MTSHLCQRRPIADYDRLPLTKHSRPTYHLANYTFASDVCPLGSLEALTDRLSATGKPPDEGGYMRSNILDIVVLARGFVNATSNTHDGLEILRDWNTMYHPDLHGLPDDPQVLWSQLRTMDFIHLLVSYACGPLDLDAISKLNSTAASDLLDLQTHSIITIRRLLCHPGVWANFVADSYISAFFRTRTSQCFTRPFNKAVEGILTHPQHLSIYRTSLIGLLSIVFRWARTIGDAECIKSFDRDCVLLLIFYAFLDPMAYHPSRPPYIWNKVEVLGRCGDILGIWASTMTKYHQYENKAAEEFFEKHGALKMAKWFRNVFTDEQYGDQHVILAAAEVILYLTNARRLGTVYAESGILEDMVVRFWSCIRKLAKENKPTAEVTQRAGKLLATFAHTVDLTETTVETAIHRFRSPSDHVRDVVLLLGRAIMIRKKFDDAVDPVLRAIERYISRRQLDEALELQVEHAMLGAAELVLRSLREAVRSGALSEEYGPAVIIKWKIFMAGCVKGQAADYTPRYTRENPYTKKPYDACTWYRCPLYGVQAGQMTRQPLICAGCQVISYCSTECQRRDWQEGRHKSQCSAPMGLDV